MHHTCFRKHTTSPCELDPISFISTLNGGSRVLAVRIRTLSVFCKFDVYSQELDHISFISNPRGGCSWKMSVDAVQHFHFLAHQARTYMHHTCHHMPSSSLVADGSGGIPLSEGFFTFLIIEAAGRWLRRAWS